MTSKQLSEFEKSQIVTYNDWGLSLCDITKKLNCFRSSIDILPINYFLKMEIIIKKKIAATREKLLHLMLMDTLANIKGS